ncbi:MAG TPA: 50S ribosomal protein L23 [Candidatus Pacebacteria bacterium]|nr:50S ribosomal protein L23 [Candidatus Paceibacterota bacterium]
MGIFSKKTEEGTTGVVKKDAEKNQLDSKSKKAEKKNDIVSTTGAYNTIIAPIVTEKSHEMVVKHKYTFRVAKTASKAIVKKVVEDMYGVTVKNVNMIVVKPKRRTVKQDRGYQKLYKKAIVTVREGDHIAVFEGI